MSVDCRLAIISSPVHILKDHSHHPYNSQQMIDMLMGNKNIPHLFPVKPGRLQLMQDHTSASTINHKMVFLITDDKTRIIALRDCGISRSKNR